MDIYIHYLYIIIIYRDILYIIIYIIFKYISQEFFMIWSDHRVSGSSLTLKFQWPQFLFFISEFVKINSLFGSLFFGNLGMKIS